MQRDVKIGIAIGVLLIALIAIFWWVRNHQAAGNENEMPAATNETMPGPISPVAPADGGSTVADGSAISAPGATTTTLPGGAPAAGATAASGATGAVPPAPTPAAAASYTVVAGDSLAKISKQSYGTEAKWKLIADANHLTAPYALKLGQKLVIPPSDSSTPAPAAGATGPAATTPSHATPPAAGAKTHKVVKGDTLTKISTQYYGNASHVDAIYQANKAKMTSKDDLKEGMVLTIP